MKQLEMLYEGKAKQVFRTDDPDKIIIHYKDAATAFNNIKKATIENKGVLNNAISTLIFKELHKAGVKTHYIETINDRDQVCRRVTIIPLEVIVRNVIAGSMAQRLGIEEGTQPSNVIFDICYKKDELGDPLINDHHAVALGAATYEELNEMYAMTAKINEVLKELFLKMNIKLVDFKIEFGKTSDGEIVTIDKQGIRSRDYSMYKRHEMCSMEYIYFARPDSDIDGCNVHAYRKESGRLLWKEAPAEADIVVGVPDSSLSAAMGYAEASGLPYEMGLIKNKYIGRTFIQPSQELREKGVRMKLSAVRSIVRGKRVVLVDDSIVRGTTSRRIVTMLKEAGATEVHVRIASPPMTDPCFYGVDTSTREELISARKNTAGVCEEIGADSLVFLSPESLLKAGSRKELCMACFTGQYPTALYQSPEEANKDVKC